jgi:hypothetical protein
MNTRHSSATCFLRSWLSVFLAGLCAAVLAQDSTMQKQGSLFGDDDDTYSSPEPRPTDQMRQSRIQNAILEGVQLSNEAGSTPDEKVVTCYFIFREQPSSYYYDSKLKDKKIIFEFNDTELGASPIPSLQESPIQGFRMESSKTNVNEAIQGLKPEWHDILRVSFFMDAIPQISVKDEYSLISFSFKWSSDPAKQEKYAIKGKEQKTLLFASLGVGVAAGAGIAAWMIWGPKDTVPSVKLPLDTADLPDHPTLPRLLPGW